MEKIWLESYQEGVPYEIDTSHLGSIVEVFNRSVVQFADRPAFACMSRVMTYRDLDRLSQELASYMQQTWKIQPGDRVALMMPNLLQFPVALFAVLRIGAIVVNVNPLYTPRELAYQLIDSGAVAIIILENFANVLEKVLPQTSLNHVMVTAVGDLLGFPKGVLVNYALRYVRKAVPTWHLPGAIGFKEALAEGKRLSMKSVSLTQDSLAFLQYTGGTTGRPKGAMLSHGNLVANVRQILAWVHPVVRVSDEVMLTALPLYHIFALTVNLLAFVEMGSLNVLIVNPRDITALIQEIKRYPITCMTGVNTLFNAMLNHADFSTIDFSTWKVALGAGMAVQEIVAERWQTLTGMPLIEGYGLTETSPVVCANPLYIKKYNGYIGLPVSSTEIEIRDEAGHEVVMGETGELCVRGPQVMQGYWNQPDETAHVLDENGFLATGDIAMITKAGFVKIVDRKKDMILVSGFNVYPNEIEDVVAKYPGVQEVACVGVGDAHSGEVVHLFIVPKEGTQLDGKEIINYCRENLTAYKVPKEVTFRKELPKNNVGKILRRALRETATSEGCTS